MALLPSDSFNELTRFRKGMDNFFSDFPSMFSQADHRIKVDVHETDKEVIATCDVPGVENKEDIDLNVDENSLSIKGTMHRSNEVEDEHMHRRERYTGTFYRSIPLPSPVSDENVKATYKNGVLEVKMQKLQKEDKKKIDVSFE